MITSTHWARWLVVVVCLWCPLVGSAQLLLFVSEYSTGNLRAFDPTSGGSIPLPPGYTPVGGSSAGADGMVTDTAGRLYVNRDGGDIYRRSLDGLTFSVFTTISGSPTLLDLTRNTTHLFAASYGTPTIYRISLADGSWSSLSPPTGFDTSDGVRIGPDGRLYAVDSSDGEIYAYNFATHTWTTFLSSPPIAGLASQMEFYGDHVFVSRTVSGQGRIYRYSLAVSGDYNAGLNPLSETLVGHIGFTTATGIRIGPDGRLYANAFNNGEIWRSNVGITAMDSSPWVSGVSAPGSLYFAAIPEPATVAMTALGALMALILRRRLGVSWRP